MFGHGVHSLLHGKKMVNEVGLFEGVGKWGQVIFDDQVGDFVTSVVSSELDGVIRVATFDIIFDDVFHYPSVEFIVIRELVSIVYDLHFAYPF